MPRSLNDPVGFIPSCLIRKASTPTDLESGTSYSGVAPSCRDAFGERERVGVAPDALALEVVERREIGVPNLEQSVTLVAGVADVLERWEGFATLDTLEPDAVVGVVGNRRLLGGETETHYQPRGRRGRKVRGLSGESSAARSALPRLCPTRSAVSRLCPSRPPCRDCSPPVMGIDRPARRSLSYSCYRRFSAIDTPFRSLTRRSARSLPLAPPTARLRRRRF